jgi:hypothetical protein
MAAERFSPGVPSPYTISGWDYRGAGLSSSSTAIMLARGYMPSGRRAFPSGTRFAPVWDAKPHAPTPFCGVRDSGPHRNCGAVGCVRS